MSKKTHSVLGYWVVAVSAAMGMAACNSTSSPGLRGDTAPPSVTSGSGTGVTTAGGGSQANDLGPTCTGVPGQLCIGLNYYVFDDANGNPIVPQSTAVANVQAANVIWAQCKIAFQMESFQDVNAANYGLSTSSASEADMTTMFTDFASSTDFVIISYSGTVPSGADAWTEEGGSGSSGPYGTIMDLSTDNYSPILAHELGHWLGLEDSSNVSDLMDLVVYASPDTLSSSECATAVSVAQTYWAPMLRQ
jgi:hypothetical protein